MWYKMDEYRQVVPCQPNAPLESRWKWQTPLPFGYFVSTVFLSLNHNFKDGPPIVFETMVFHNGSSYGDTGELYQTRCSTYPQALWMHIKGLFWAVKQILKEILK